MYFPLKEWFLIYCKIIRAVLCIALFIREPVQGHIFNYKIVVLSDRSVLILESELFSLAVI